MSPRELNHIYDKQKISMMVELRGKRKKKIYIYIYRHTHTHIYIYIDTHGKEIKNYNILLNMQIH